MKRFERFAVLSLEEAKENFKPFSGIRIKPEYRYKKIFKTPYCEICNRPVDYVAIERDHNSLSNPWKYNFYSKDHIMFEVHHIIPKSKNGKNNLSNLLTVCSPCHKKLHKER